MSLHLKQCSIKQRSALIRTAKANVSASKDIAHRKTTCWLVSSAELKRKTKHRSRISCEWKDLKHWKWHVSVSLLIVAFFCAAYANITQFLYCNRKVSWGWAPFEMRESLVPSRTATHAAFSFTAASDEWKGSNDRRQFVSEDGKLPPQRRCFHFSKTLRVCTIIQSYTSSFQATRVPLRAV